MCYRPAFMINWCLCIIIFAAPTLCAQEALGLRVDNYMGIHTALLNPARTAYYPLRWDINLVGIEHFTANNYAYLKNTGLGDIINNGENIRLASDATTAPNTTPIIADFYTHSRKRFVATHTTITGPSALFNWGEGAHTAGIFTQARFAFTVMNLPSNLAYYTYENQPLLQPLKVDPFDGALLSWREIGLHYAYKHEAGWSLGANLKNLAGYEAVYFKNLVTADLTKLSGDSLNFPDVSAELGFTTSQLKNNNTQPTLQRNGGGWAIDIGGTWAQAGDEGYALLVGASLLDVGAIRFRRNTRNFSFSSDSLVQWDTRRYKTGYTVADYDRLANSLSYDIFGDSTATFAGTDFSVWLPAALSLQAEAQVLPHVFVNATAVQRLPIGQHAIKRNNMLSVGAQVSYRWWAVGVPIILHNYQSLRVGASVRLAFLTLGTDNLFSLIRQREWTGTSLYVALHINPFSLGGGSLFGGGGRTIPGGSGLGGKHRQLGCYQF